MVFAATGRVDDDGPVWRLAEDIESNVMVRIQHPLLEALREFDREATVRFPTDLDNGLGQMGMLLHSELKNCGYWCTPKNSVAFASTGSDGVHFSFVVLDDEVSENSPVIVTVPAYSGEPDVANFVVADNLRNFLRFGLHRGYFALEELAYHRDLTLEVYSSADWQPTEDWHHSVGYCLGENEQRVRDFLVERFDLTPLAYTVAEFEALQDKYKPLLEYRAEGEW